MKSLTPTRTLLQIFVLATALLILSGYHYMEAQWTPPPSPAPGGNVDAPINIGSDAQVKSGNMGANIVSAIDQMWAPEYCDVTGNNCFDFSSCAVGEVIVRGASGWECTPL